MHSSCINWILTDCCFIYVHRQITGYAWQSHGEAQRIDQRSQNWNGDRNCEKKEKQKRTVNCKTSWEKKDGSQKTKKKMRNANYEMRNRNNNNNSKTQREAARSQSWRISRRSGVATWHFVAFGGMWRTRSALGTAHEAHTNSKQRAASRRLQLSQVFSWRSADSLRFELDARSTQTRRLTKSTKHKTRAAAADDVAAASAEPQSALNW